jgi:transposase
MQTDPFIVGVDVSKDTLACCVNGARHELANSEATISTWLRKLPARSIVAMEGTGRYHLLLASLAHQAGMRVYVLNAKDVYFYVKALGTRSKTDMGDAAVIARYLAEHVDQLHPWAPGTNAQRQLQELVRRRSGITSHRASLRQMLSPVAPLRDAFNELDARFDLLLTSLDRQIEALIDADHDMKQADAALQTITGIKLVGSALLISLLSRIPFANVDAFVAYSGLDPRANDSGQRRGTRRLSKKGPPELRRQMYLAAFSATRSKVFKPIYHALLAKGFKTTEAFVILARKILRIAWAVWKSRRPFDPVLANPNVA